MQLTNRQVLTFARHVMEFKEFEFLLSQVHTHTLGGLQRTGKRRSLAYAESDTFARPPGPAVRDAEEKSLIRMCGNCSHVAYVGDENRQRQWRQKDAEASPGLIDLRPVSRLCVDPSPRISKAREA